MKGRISQKIKTRLKIWGVSFVSLVMMVSMGLTSLVTPVLADDGIKEVETSLWGKVDTSGKDTFFKLLYTFVNILIYGMGALAVIGVVIAGVLYITSGDNEQKAVAARKRLIEVVIGLGVWALLYIILQILIPGGPNFEAVK